MSRASHLRNLNFKINAGETVALVGPTGSGKTSIADLSIVFTMSGPTSVSISSFDVRDVTKESLGDHVAMVLQEPFLFSGTILKTFNIEVEIVI